jgi:hypothetical protein
VAFQGFVNRTPFAAEPFVLSDERGGDVFTCVVKATFSFQHHRDGTTLAVAGEQVPPCVKPVYYGEPAESSIKYDSDAVLTKTGTDVVLVGHAYAPEPGARYADVSLAVGPARSVVRVFGDRVWTTALGRWAPSLPESFEAIPLVYERAFGGWDRTSPNPAHHDFDPRNPVGVGFVSKKHSALQAGSPLPNLEDPYQLIGSPTDRPAPAGFGFIGAHWQPRIQYAGTYDQNWEQRRMPLLPDDFDRRFYNAAHPALTLQGFLAGGEPVEIVNASPRGVLRFWLPVAQPFASVRMNDGGTHRVGMALDTVIVEPDEDRLFLVWRGSLSLHNRLHDVVWAKAQLLGDGGVTQ